LTTKDCSIWGILGNGERLQKSRALMARSKFNTGGGRGDGEMLVLSDKSLIKIKTGQGSLPTAFAELLEEGWQIGGIVSKRMILFQRKDSLTFRLGVWDFDSQRFVLPPQQFVGRDGEPAYCELDTAGNQIALTSGRQTELWNVNRKERITTFGE